mgnify:CR=1 FL=1
MKRLLTLPLALFLVLSLAACSEGGDQTADMTKEDMLAAAETVDAAALAGETTDDPAAAQETYCGKILEITAPISAIEEDYIRLRIGDNVTPARLDVYLPAEELADLSDDQQVTVVGITAPKIEKQTAEGSTIPVYYYTMSSGYVTQTRFEMTCSLVGPDLANNAFYLNDGTSVQKRVYFQNGVEVPTDIWGKEIRIAGTILYDEGSSTYYEVYDAELLQ